MVRIFGWTADRGGLARIRIGVPFDELANHGHTTVYNQVFDPANGDSDTVVGVRVAMQDPTRLWTHACGMLGGPFCVFETDDDVMRISAYNKYGPYQFWGRPDVRWRYTANLRVAHRVVTSTDYLANLLHDDFGHPDIVVAPNALPGWIRELPPPEPHPDGKVVVGWAGGSSHDGDWKWVRSGVRKALRQLPETIFRSVGVDYTKELRLPKYQTEYIPWFHDTDEYWRKGLNFDIGLAPLEPGLFNRSKSDIKLKELAARGIPVIASNYGPYASFVKDGETGLLVKTSAEWTEAIMTLVQEPALRQAMQKAAKQQAAQHTIEALWTRYEEAYTP